MMYFRDKKKYHIYISILSIMLVLSIVKFIIGYPVYLLYIFSLLASVVILKCESGKINNVQQKPVSNWSRIIILIILSAALIVRCFLQIRINRNFNIHTDESVLIKLRWFIVFLICGFFEELLIKLVLYERIIQSKLPKVLSIVICCIYFTLLHKTETYYGYIGIFLYQLITLLMYDKYPNIYVYSVYHCLRNFIFYI